MLLCGFLGGWTLADTSWEKPYPLVVVALGGWAALRVGVAMEHRTSFGKEVAHSSHKVWMFFAFVGLVVGILGVMQQPHIQKDALTGFNALVSMAGMSMVMMALLVMAVGFAEKYVMEDSQEPVEKDKNVMPWWVSASSSAVIVAMVGLSGLNVAIRYQSNPNTVWGWWNSKAQTEQHYQTGRLSAPQFEKEISRLETARLHQASKKVAETLLPRQTIPNIASQHPTTDRYVFDKNVGNKITQDKSIQKL